MAVSLCIRALRRPGTALLRASSSSSATSLTHPPGPAERSDHEEVNVYEKNADWHGFSTDPYVDKWNMRMVFFCGISMSLVLGSVFLHYLPDHGMRQWARREAERQLKRKEALGLALIDHNYYDPDKLVLPPQDD